MYVLCDCCKMHWCSLHSFSNKYLTCELEFSHFLVHLESFSGEKYVIATLVPEGQKVQISLRNKILDLLHEKCLLGV